MKDETTPDTDTRWADPGVDLDENERRAAWYALACRIEAEEKRNPPGRPSTKRQWANLLKGEKKFLESISAPIGRGDRMAFSVDERGDNVVACAEALRALRKRIDKASGKGMTKWVLTYGADFCGAALDRFMQAAPDDTHEHLKLEVVDGVVREIGKETT